MLITQKMVGFNKHDTQICSRIKSSFILSDAMWTVNKGSLQHTGDNIVALVKGLDKASEVDDLTVSPLCKPF